MRFPRGVGRFIGRYCIYRRNERFQFHEPGKNCAVANRVLDEESGPLVDLQGFEFGGGCQRSRGYFRRFGSGLKGRRDQSTGSISTWDWNFGDGSPHSSARSPSHTYNSAGTFTATSAVAVTAPGGPSRSAAQIRAGKTR